MQPIVSVDQMRAMDAVSPVPESQLIERAGHAVGRHAKQMLGGTYGRRVVVVAGGGNNGADGRVAARWLRSWGARVAVLHAKEAEGSTLPKVDLVIDAAYGTGFHGSYRSPDAQGAPVLAVDIPSGVNGDSGVAVDGAVKADATVTFAALKPGLLYGDGPQHCGDVHLADIGLEMTEHVALLVEDVDFGRIPGRGHDSHKWKNSVAVIAGSPEMMGAAVLATRGAQRAGASAVRLMSPCPQVSSVGIAEALTAELRSERWDADALKLCERAQAVVIGPGLGRDQSTIESVLTVLANLEVPVVCDADALFVLTTDRGRAVLAGRKAPTILTPHDAEFERLAGTVGESRLAATVAAANSLNATVLLKGSTTTVASPDGQVMVSTSGSSRLATAGSGDVLSGVIAALAATGLDTLSSAAIGAHLHGRAAALGRPQGLLAGDLADLVSDVLSAHG